jgi:membrane associated rhomboid family serine protease
MIPIKDSPRARRFPFVNVALLVANAAVFWLELTLGPGRLEGFIHTYGLIPARLWQTDWASPAGILAGAYPLVTAVFIHAGWVHILGNLLFLYIFGDNVEDAFGHVAYGAFYLVCGAGACLAQAALKPASTMPVIGASGAIAGVMGAYLILYPKARVLTLIPLLFYPWLIEIPAWFYLGLWVIINLFSGALDLAGARTGGVAWWAHLGGFILGVAAALLAPRRRRHAYAVAP